MPHASPMPSGDQGYEALWAAGSDPVDRWIYRSEADHAVSMLRPEESFEAIVVVEIWFSYPRWWQSFRAPTLLTGVLGVSESRLVFSASDAGFDLPRDTSRKLIDHTRLTSTQESWPS